MARSISTSLLALALASLALAAPGDDRAQGAAAPAPAVGYVPGGDADVDAAVLRGLSRALAESGVELEVGRAPHAWSNAAPEAVRLVFEEGVRLLVTPPDRRVAHLMAQVATRVQVPLVSTAEAPSVGATGSRWVSVATRTTEEEDWEEVGFRAGRQALALPAGARSRRLRGGP